MLNNDKQIRTLLLAHQAPIVRDKCSCGLTIHGLVEWSNHVAQLLQPTLAKFLLDYMIGANDNA